MLPRRRRLRRAFAGNVDIARRRLIPETQASIIYQTSISRASAVVVYGVAICADFRRGGNGWRRAREGRGGGSMETATVTGTGIEGGRTLIPTKGHCGH